MRITEVVLALVLGALPAYYLFPIYFSVGFALLLGVMSIRPTDILAIRAVSVALALRLVPAPAGIEISKVICVAYSRRP